jgi:hypothetical protein
MRRALLDQATSGSPWLSHPRSAQVSSDQPRWAKVRAKVLAPRGLRVRTPCSIPEVLGGRSSRFSGTSLDVAGRQDASRGITGAGLDLEAAWFFRACERSLSVLAQGSGKKLGERFPSAVRPLEARQSPKGRSEDLRRVPVRPLPWHQAGSVHQVAQDQPVPEADDGLESVPRL